MTPESSPFRPGQPVQVELFVGRQASIERLRGLVRAANQGSFKIGFIAGERGIGKSSVASFVRYLCEKESGVTGCHVYLGGVHDLDDMARATFDRLLKDSIDRPWHQRIVEFFGNRIRQVGLFGVSVELNLTRHDLRTISTNFITAIRDLVTRLEAPNSLLIILDDINGLANSSDFAHWLKSIVDEIATSRKATKLCILLVGLEERRQELIAHQPSLARVFDLIDIAPWSIDEVRQFFNKSFESRNTVVSEPELSLMAEYTGGLPVLAHEIGDAIWHVSDGPAITRANVVEGIVQAAEIVGRKLLEPQVFGAIQSDLYRSILRKIAGSMGMQFSRREVAQLLTQEELSVLDNFLRRMDRLGAVQREPGMRGRYRFLNRLHAIYFHMDSMLNRRGGNS